MSEIDIKKFKFLNQAIEVFNKCRDEEMKVDLLVEEYWHPYSVGWRNLIININKILFEIDEEDPLDGLKEAYSEKAEVENVKKFIPKFYNLVENWDDVFGDAYYEIRSSLKKFVFKDSISILNELCSHVSDSEKLKDIVRRYEESMRRKS